MDGIIVAALFKIGDGFVHRNHVMAVRGAFKTLNADAHLAFVDDRKRSRRDCRFAEPPEKSIYVFTVAFDERQAMPCECLAHIKAGQVVRGMACDSHVVVINHQLDVEPSGDCDAGCLGIVAFLLRPVGTEAEHGLVRISHRHAIDVGPHVP